MIEQALPILNIINELIEALGSSKQVVLSAEPGAGKTTRVPLACLEVSWLSGKKIIMLEPRRLAALGAARYIASLLGEKPGETVGYRMRADTAISKATRLEIVTEGVLTRMLQEDPALEGVGLLVFDEFHERSLQADLGLALALDAQSTIRPDLKILIMSATLDIEGLLRILPEAKEIKCAGRCFPVETVYVEPAERERVEVHAAQVALRALSRHAGDVLVFLPGQAEIGRAIESLGKKGIGAEFEALPLYGDLGLDLQKRIFVKTEGERPRMIFSTNIAETSLTVPGIGIVVDSGLTRVSYYDPARGLSALETVKVSQASADQRRGRAGRLGPGVCYRLWSEKDHQKLCLRNSPEILNADLVPFALDIALWGTSKVAELKLIDPPQAGVLESARELLGQLGALDSKGAITEHGREMAKLGVHPRLAHMIIRANDFKLSGVACDLAMILEERDFLANEKVDLDIERRLDLLNGFRNRPGAVGGRRALFDRMNSQAKRLRSLVRGQNKAEVNAYELGGLLAFAFPDRIGKRRESGSRRYLLSSGAGAELPANSLLSKSEYLVVCALDGSSAHAKIRLAQPVLERQIIENFQSLLEVKELVEWNSREEKVVAVEQVCLGAVVLSEKPAENSGELCFKAMLAGLRELGIEALPWTKSAKGIKERCAFLHSRQLVENTFPNLDDATLLDKLEIWLGPFMGGVRSKEALESIPLEQALRRCFNQAELRLLEKLAPVEIDLPSGRRAWLDYSRPGAAVLSVPLQEMYGQVDTPRVGGGKVPVLLELLSPAGRPLQVTSDLASFWQNSYRQVRQEMISRYPKHYWAEDPKQAKAGMRRRGKK